ncbi:hypothetical protein CDV49_05495 [Haematobacter genomosp. 1]|uniref:Uncharacterized protein n=1 Tax=Haematobacter genomosp. 1 TaxID=366618 RepID=A0A212ADP0_9RHOB|nr:hypothetical protein CDV49_05495 [Haematobacter genomosp. 1]
MTPSVIRIRTGPYEMPVANRLMTTCPAVHVAIPIEARFVDIFTGMGWGVSPPRTVSEGG